METYNLVNANFIDSIDFINKINSVTICNGKIIAINNPKSSAPSIDLSGNTVIPGFIDSHFHLKNFGKRLDQLDLKGIHSLDEIKNKIEQKISISKPGEWILGFGWDQNLWPNQDFPNACFLDKISPNNPIYLTRIDGHSAWINKFALDQANIQSGDLKNIKGGDIINDCILIDNAMNDVQKLLPPDSLSQVKKWILTAANKAVEMGLTAVHDAWQDRLTIKAIQELIDEDNFPIRCYGMLASNDTELLNSFFKNGHYYSKHLVIRSVKAFIDGALGSRGAALHEPYCDDHKNCGLILISQEAFDELVQNCYKYNFQLNTHAIGDRGNTYVLNAYGKVLKNKNNKRWRIEHAQMVNERDLYRFKEHSILPSMQPSHCTSDMNWMPDRIGQDRLKMISRWQSFINLGIPIPGGSDCPIESGNPLFEFYAAVTRQNHEGMPKQGWQPQEKVKHKDALKMFTTWGAYGSFCEHIHGQIKEGYNADFTILSDNILNIPNHKILQNKIKMVIVDGKIILDQ